MTNACFIIGAFNRRIVGWQVAPHIGTSTVIGTAVIARPRCRSRGLTGFVAYADAGSQVTSVRVAEGLEEMGARPSTGIVATSFRRALL